MKTKSLSIMIIAVIISVFTISCSKKSTDDPISNPATTELSFVANASTYNNQSFKFARVGMALYDVEMLATGCNFSDEVNNSALLGFEGNTTGSFAVNDTDNSLVINYDDNTSILALTQGTITVTKYGNVGDWITGTFTGSGVVSHDFNEPVAITIKEGKFSVKRAL